MWQTLDFYEVGTYWPSEGSYGIPSSANTLEECSEKVEKLLSIGYGVGGSHPSEIHVRHVKIERVSLSLLPLKFTHFHCLDCGFEDEITEVGVETPQRLQDMYHEAD